jgi:hypothetical protein
MQFVLLRMQKERQLASLFLPGGNANWPLQKLSWNPFECDMERLLWKGHKKAQKVHQENRSLTAIPISDLYN